MSQPAFRASCSQFPTGVAIVTRMRAGVRLGVTVSSFTSVSLDPPMVLVCVHRKSSFLQDLVEADSITVNILADDQRDTSIRFSQHPPAGRFVDAQWDGTTLLAAAAVLECGLAEIRIAGDHAILIAEVFDAFSSDRSPLVYFRSGYHEVSQIPPKVSCPGTFGGSDIIQLPEHLLEDGNHLLTRGPVARE